MYLSEIIIDVGGLSAPFAKVNVVASPNSVLLNICIHQHRFWPFVVILEGALKFLFLFSGISYTCVWVTTQTWVYLVDSFFCLMHILIDCSKAPIYQITEKRAIQRDSTGCHRRRHKHRQSNFLREALHQLQIGVTRYAVSNQMRNHAARQSAHALYNPFSKYFDSFEWWRELGNSLYNSIFLVFTATHTHKPRMRLKNILYKAQLPAPPKFSPDTTQIGCRNSVRTKLMRSTVNLRPLYEQERNNSRNSLERDSIYTSSSGR